MKRTVLLVEDSNTIRHILKIYLLKLELNFLDADRAEQGLKLLGTHPVDLVIADINMPGGMDGLEFVRRVRASRACVSDTSSACPYSAVTRWAMPIMRTSAR